MSLDVATNASNTCNVKNLQIEIYNENLVRASKVENPDPRKFIGFSDQKNSGNKITVKVGRTHAKKNILYKSQSINILVKHLDHIPKKLFFNIVVHVLPCLLFLLFVNSSAIPQQFFSLPIHHIPQH